MRNIITLTLFFLLSNNFIFSQKNYYENQIYQFELPNTWSVPNEELQTIYIDYHKELAHKNNIKYNINDFLFSQKNDDENQLFMPIITCLSKQTKENIFNIIKEGFEGDYIERNFHVDKQNFSFIGKPIIDSKNKIIEFSMKSDEIYGFSILFFTDNHFVQFSYTDNNKDFCIECYLAFKSMLFNSFKFK